MKQLIVGFADVETAHDAVRTAVDLASKLGASLHVVMATRSNTTEVIGVGSDEWTVSEVDAAESAVRSFMDSLPNSVDYTVGIAVGSPGDVLVSEAERLDADLIVVGNVRMQGISRVLGSVGGAVIHNAPCSVLVVKTT